MDLTLQTLLDMSRDVAVVVNKSTIVLR